MKFFSKKIFFHKSSQLILIFLIQGISAILGFAVQFLLAKNMTVAEYGQFSILFNAVAILSLVVSFGSSNHILRYISIYSENKRKSSAELQTAILFVVFNWLVLTVLAMLFNKTFLAGTTYFFSIGIVILSSLWVLFTTFSLLFQNFDRATGYVVRSMVPNNIIKSVLMLAFIFLVVNIFGDRLQLIDAVEIYLSSFLIICCLYLFLERKYLSWNNFYRRGIARYKIFFRNSFQYFLNTISQNLLKNLDLIFIGFFLTVYDAGIYAAAARINIVIIFGLASLNILYSPQVAKLYKENKIDELNRSLRVPNWIIFIFSLILFLFIVLFGKWILGIFGPSFLQGYWVLLFLSLRNLIEALFGITGSVLNMSGNQKYFNNVLYVILGVYLVLSPFAIKIWGLEGLAIFVAIIALFKNFVQWKFIYFKLGIRSGLFSNLYYRLISR